MAVPMARDRVPYLSPPPGKVAFGNDDNLHPTFIALVSVCIALACIAFLLRTCARVKLLRRWAYEDWAASVSFVGFLVWVYTTWMMHYYNGGAHGWDVEEADVVPMMKWFMILTVVYSVENLICKLTLLHIYRTLFVTQAKSRLNYALRVGEFVLIAFYTAQFFSKLFECSPMERIWDKSVPGSCINRFMIITASGLFNLLSDLLILLVPVLSVCRLQLRFEKKFRIIFALTLGAIAPLFSAIGYAIRVKLISLPDTTYNLPFIVLFAIVEVTIGVICICLPPLGALFINRRTPHTTTTNYSGHIQPRSQQRASPINIVTPTATRRSRTSIGLREGEAFTRAEYMALNSPTELNQPQENYFNTRNDDEIAPVPLPASAPSHGNSRCPSVVVSPPDVDLPAAPGPSYQPFRHSDTFQPQMPGNLRRVKSDSRAEKEKTVKHFASFS